MLYVQTGMRWLALLTLLVALPLRAATTQVRLVLPTEAVAPGETVLAGVGRRFAHSGDERRHLDFHDPDRLLPNALTS